MTASDAPRGESRNLSLNGNIKLRIKFVLALSGGEVVAVVSIANTINDVIGIRIR